jgi:hypothetical protein
MDFDNWPDCPVDGCKNKICLSLNSDKCFPHTEGNEHVKGWKIDARNAPESVGQTQSESV